MRGRDSPLVGTGCACEVILTWLVGRTADRSHSRPNRRGILDAQPLNRRRRDAQAAIQVAAARVRHEGQRISFASRRPLSVVRLDDA